MKHPKPFLLLALLLFVLSCDKDLELDASAKGDFNLFFDYLEKDYAYRDAHDFSMKALKEKYLPVINTSLTQTTLANIIFEVIYNDLKDPHVHLKSQGAKALVTASVRNPIILEDVLPSFDEVNLWNASKYYSWGTLTANSSIGYLYIRSFNSGIGGTNSLIMEEGVKEINAILKEFNAKGITAMIVDIRSKAGGSNHIPRYIAQRFANKTSVYMHEYYPVGKGFKLKKWKITPEGQDGFRDGKIALLSNGSTCSGAEFFVLAMLQRDNLIHIGSRSAGCTGNVVEKDLANGWYFQLTNSRTEFPNGDTYFKVGISPDIEVKNTAEYPFDRTSDALIMRALQELE